MSVLSECPQCHKKQAVKNKVCQCGADLDKLKRSKKVKYWINFRMPDGKQRREAVGFSIEEARDADGKRRVQKRENRIFDILPEAKMTFRDLADWYLKLASVNQIKTYKRQAQALSHMSEFFGNKMVEHIKPEDINDYIASRRAIGRAPATVKLELSVAGSLISRAFDNDKLGARTLKAFRSRAVKSPMKAGSNARTRTASKEEFLKLLKVAKHPLSTILIMALYTGMRKGEILGLTWDKVDLKKNMITLQPEDTKEKKEKRVPITPVVRDLLKSLPRSLKSDRCITQKGLPIFPGGITKAMKKACKNAGIPYGRKIPGGLSLHDLRATTKTFMAKAGIDSAIRSVLLGHSLQGMDRYYIRFSAEDLKHAMAQYTAWLDAEIATVDHPVDCKTSNIS